jgi:hypothetical protein
MVPLSIISASVTIVLVRKYGRASYRCKIKAARWYVNYPNPLPHFLVHITTPE